MSDFSAFQEDAFQEDAFQLDLSTFAGILTIDALLNPLFVDTAVADLVVTQ